MKREGENLHASLITPSRITSSRYNSVSPTGSGAGASLGDALETEVYIQV